MPFPVLFLASTLLGLATLTIAGEQKAEAAIPECAAGVSGVCRLPIALTPEEAAARLGDEPVVWWADGEMFTILTRHPGPDVALCCTLQEPLARIGDGDLWGLAARVPGLSAGVIDILVLPPATAGPLRPEVWRGPDAPPRPSRVETLAGTVADHVLDSAVMGEGRKVTVYTPPNTPPNARLPVIYMADGGGAEAYAHIVEALIAEGRIPPVILVGDWPGPEGERKPGDPDWRAQEYVPGFPGGEERFLAHRRYVDEELIPWIERRFPASSDPGDRIAVGQSNGGAWALGVLREQPQVFRKGILMSPAGREPRMFETLAGARIYVGAGTLETLGERVPRITDGARAAGAQVESMSPVGGHSPEVWNMVFANGLIWVLDP